MEVCMSIGEKKPVSGTWNKMPYVPKVSEKKSEDQKASNQFDDSIVAGQLRSPQSVPTKTRDHYLYRQHRCTVYSSLPALSDIDKSEVKQKKAQYESLISAAAKTNAVKSSPLPIYQDNNEETDSPHTEFSAIIIDIPDNKEVTDVPRSAPSNESRLQRRYDERFTYPATELGTNKVCTACGHTLEKTDSVDNFDLEEITVDEEETDKNEGTSKGGRLSKNAKADGWVIGNRPLPKREPLPASSPYSRASIQIIATQKFDDEQPSESEIKSPRKKKLTGIVKRIPILKRFATESTIQKTKVMAGNLNSSYQTESSTSADSPKFNTWSGVPEDKKRRQRPSILTPHDRKV